MFVGDYQLNYQHKKIMRLREGGQEAVNSALGRRVRNTNTVRVSAALTTVSTVGPSIEATTNASSGLNAALCTLLLHLLSAPYSIFAKSWCSHSVLLGREGLLVPEHLAFVRSRAKT